MRRRHSALFAFFAAIGVATACVAATKSGDNKNDVTYKWVDEKGIVHYGDSVPPEYAKRERKVLNDEGVEIEHVDAEKSPEQLAIEAQRQREISQREQHDKFLLVTYTSVADIESLRDKRLEQITGQSKAALQYVELLDSRLTGLQARAQLFKPYSDAPTARRMPDELAADLVRTLNELRSQRNLLEAKRREQESIETQFRADIERYRQLRGIS